MKFLLHLTSASLGLPCREGTARREDKSPPAYGSPPKSRPTPSLRLGAGAAERPLGMRPGWCRGDTKKAACWANRSILRYVAYYPGIPPSSHPQELIKFIPESQARRKFKKTKQKPVKGPEPVRPFRPRLLPWRPVAARPPAFPRAQPPHCPSDRLRLPGLKRRRLFPFCFHIMFRTIKTPKGKGTP